MLSRAIMVLSACCATTLCSAATLSPQSGSVYVNAGAGFVPVQAAEAVAPAAKIMISPGGSALVTYSSTCAVRLTSGVWSVQEQPPCEEGVALIDFTGRMNQETPPTTEGPGTTALIVGGVVVAGAVTAAIVLSQDDDDKPASP